MNAYVAAFATSARDALRYRRELLGRSVFLGLVLFVFDRVWRTVAAHADTGRTPGQLVLYLLVTEAVTFAPGGWDTDVSKDVRSGDLAVQLLRPVDFVAWHVARQSGAALVTMAWLLLTVGPFALLAEGAAGLRPAGVACGLALAAMAVVVSCSIRTLIGLCAFWIEDAQPLSWVWQKAGFVLGGLFLPLDMYPPWLRAVAEVLPFQALLYGPARTAVDFQASFALATALRLLGWGAVIVATLHLVHARAARRIQLQGG